MTRRLTNKERVTLIQIPTKPKPFSYITFILQFLFYYHAGRPIPPTFDPEITLGVGLVEEFNFSLSLSLIFFLPIIWSSVGLRGFVQLTRHKFLLLLLHSNSPKEKPDGRQAGALWWGRRWGSFECSAAAEVEMLEGLIIRARPGRISCLSTSWTSSITLLRFWLFLLVCDELLMFSSIFFFFRKFEFVYVVVGRIWRIWKIATITCFRPLPPPPTAPTVIG